MYGINIVNIFLSGKRKNIFLFIAGSSCLMAFKLIISHLHASARLGNICAGNRCPSRDAVCLAHFLSGGMWLSDRNDAEL